MERRMTSAVTRLNAMVEEGRKSRERERERKEIDNWKKIERGRFSLLSLV